MDLVAFGSDTDGGWGDDVEVEVAVACKCGPGGNTPTCCSPRRMWLLYFAEFRMRRRMLV